MKFVVFVMSALASMAMPVLAQESGQISEREDGGYIRVGAGAVFLNDWEQDFAYNPDLVFVSPSASGQTIANGRGFLASAALGFDYADGIRTELEYRYASTSIETVILADPAGPLVVTPPNDDINAHFIMSNFYFDFYNQSPLTPFVGGGVGGAFVENEVGARDAALAWQVRGGVSYGFNSGWSADLEYIYLRSNELVYGTDIDDLGSAGPFDIHIDGSRYVSSSVMMSLRKQF